MKKVITLFSLIMLVYGNHAFAEKSEKALPSVENSSYSVKKIKPGNEINETSSFYDLRVSQGEKKEIQAVITNSSNESMLVKSKIFTAFTNENGAITYNGEPKKYSKSLSYKISDFTTINPTDIISEVPAHSEKIVTAAINIPSNVSDGAILGSWYFEKEDQVADRKEEQGIGINNKYSYSLAIKLTVNKEIEQPELKLNNVTTGLSNYRKVIQANMENQSPAIVSKLTINAQILNEKSKEVLYESHREELIMAPNSTFHYPIFLKDKEMKEGDYILNLEAKTDDPKWPSQKWNWSQKFRVTKENVEKMNKEALNDGYINSFKKNNKLVIFSLIILIFALIATIILSLMVKKKLLNKSKKKRKQDKRKNKNVKKNSVRKTKKITDM